MEENLVKKLAAFVEEKGFMSQGPLSVALVVTQHARKMGLPLDPNKLLAKRGAQVLGQGKSAVQKVLKRHGIDRVLAQEGGRTSRGSPDNMRSYVALLNELHAQEGVDLDEIEQFWIVRVHEYFAAKPFKIRLDPSRSLRMVVGDVIKQAQERQKTAHGVYYAGAVMQHLVGAKLDCVLGIGKIEHNSFSTADAPLSRAGDFLAGDVAIHVTTTPGDALVQKCRDNLNEGLRPLIVTGQKGAVIAANQLENYGLGDRIDVFEIEQFVAANLYELGAFAATGRRTAVNDLVERYNQVVEKVETNPSLKIELGRAKEKKSRG
jgi:hypothetical protein